jgi:hypothetical protein
MKIVDVFPRVNPTNPRPICENKISNAVLEQNAACLARLQKQGGVSNETLQKRMRRRVQYNLPADRCQNGARYQIDGKWYCRKHAAYVVLDRLVEKSPPPPYDCPDCGVHIFEAHHDYHPLCLACGLKKRYEESQHAES